MTIATVVTLLEALAPALLLIVVIGGAMLGTLWVERWDERQEQEQEEQQDR